MGHDEKRATDCGLDNELAPEENNGQSTTAPPSPPLTSANVACRCLANMDVGIGGCTLRALEARIAEESTARIAAEVRAERAESRACDLQAKLTIKGEVDFLSNGGGGCAPGVDEVIDRRLRQLKVELREANAWASKAEEMLRNREGKCEHMTRELFRLEGVCQQMKLQLDSLKGTTDTAPCSPALANVIPSEFPPESGCRDEFGANCNGVELGGGQIYAKRLTPEASDVVHGAKETTVDCRSMVAIDDPAMGKVGMETTTTTDAMLQGCGTQPQHLEVSRGAGVSNDFKVNPTSSASSKCFDTRAIHGSRDQGGAAAAAVAAAAVAAASAGGCSSFYSRKFTLDQRMAPPMSPPSGGIMVTSRQGLSRGPDRATPTASTVSNCSSPLREDARRGQRASASGTAPCTALNRGLDRYDEVKCIEIPVGREDEVTHRVGQTPAAFLATNHLDSGLLLGGGRVLHKLKEELGGTLEYRRSQGVVCVYGQQGGLRKAAACVRTALLLRDGSGEPQAEEYSLGRLCMDDLLAECIALKGMGQAGGSGTRRQKPWSDTHSSAGSNSHTSSSTDDSSSPTRGMEPWNTVQGVCSSSSPTSATTPSPTASVAAAAAAAAAAVSVASNLPDGEYPPETASLRIIGEKYGCVIDVAGEIASDAAAAAINATLVARAAGRIEESGVLRPVGSATPVGHQDVLIWGPTAAVGEAKDAVAALVSGNASAEVVIGTKRIQRRDRGFWVNCETMANGLEIDHKRGSAWMRGRPAVVEECRREFQNKLASLFPGDFLAVPMPRAALKDLANARGLAAAGAEAKADRAGADDKGYGDEPDGVELWADWPCSSVRLRGEPSVVRRAAKALYAALAKWNTLEVSVQVDRNIVTRLLSRSGRILAGISSNMGITLLVEREKGVLRGRARTEEDAKEANRVLKLKVAALSHRRSEPTTSSANPTTPGPLPSKGPVLSPGLSSTLSERSGASVGSDDSPDDREKELTDPFDELQAFFAGAPRSDGPSDGRNPTAPSKRSCVFDGVEDVPSSTGVSGSSGGKGSANQRNGGRGQAAPSRGAPSRGSRNVNGGGGVSVSAGAMTKSRAGYDHHHHQQHHHVVHANRRSVIIHGPALSPPSGSAGSPSFAGTIGSDDGGGRRGGGGGHHAYHLHSASPPPPQLPPPLTSHQIHQQHYQLHHHKAERRTTWAIHKEEHSHLSRHQSHSHNHHGRQPQPLFTNAAPSHGSHTSVAREEMDAARAYEGRVRRATGGDMYGIGGAAGCRGEVGYTASLANGVVSYANERPRNGVGGMSGRSSPIPLGNEDFEYDAPVAHKGLVRWTSDSGAYPMHSAAYNPVVRTVRTSGRGW